MAERGLTIKLTKRSDDKVSCGQPYGACPTTTKTSTDSLQDFHGTVPVVKESKGIFAAAVEWHNNRWTGANIPMVLFIVVVFLSLWWVNPDEALPRPAWHVFVIFVCTIIGAIAEPLPLAGVCLCSLAVCGVTSTLTTKEILSGFSNSTIWLVMFSFFMSNGLIVTGLGKRICFIIVKFLGSTTIGLAYGICCCEFILAMAIPSSTARAAGVMFPILTSLLKDAFGSDPAENTQDLIGTYLIMVEVTADAIASTLWMTGGAWNSMIVQFLKDEGVDLNWLTWAVSLAPPVLIQLLLVPPVVYLIVPPKIKKSPEAKNMAIEKLKEMGMIRGKELIMLIVFIGVVLLWILCSATESMPFSSTLVAVMGIAVLLLLGVLDSNKHIVTDQTAFSLLLWFSVLLMLASQLQAKGFFDWFGSQINLSHMSPYGCLALVCFIFYITQYLFASVTAHVTALFVPLLQVCKTAGVPLQVAGRALAACTWSGHLTPYSSSGNPPYYSLGYVSAKQWYTTGAVVFVVNYVGLITIGFGYWWCLNFWKADGQAITATTTAAVSAIVGT